MLTQAAAEAAMPRDRGYKLAAGAGMHLHIAPTGAKSWRLKYRFAGREKLLTLGRFPAVDIAGAGDRRDAARAQLADGIDPASAPIAIDTFEQLARAWFAHNRDCWSDTHAADVIGSLERDVFPAIGARPVAAIGAPALLQLLGRVEKRGAIETARRLRQRLSKIFKFGIVLELADRDPAAPLEAALKAPPPDIPHPALLDIGECCALLAAADLAPAQPSTKLASRFLALTAVRLDAVRGMRWSEVDLEVNAPVWIVPAERMKLARAKKGEARFDHTVPLSAAAIAVLRDAKCMNMHHHDANSLVFPGRSADAPIGEGTIGELYDRCGYAGRHVPHGWRASFSTIMNEELGEDWARTIDRALAHSPKDKVEAAYNRAQLLERRRAVFDRWGELLTSK